MRKNLLTAAFALLATLHLDLAASAQINTVMYREMTREHERMLRGTEALPGDLSVSGHVYEHQCRVYAYLTAPSNTTVASSGVYVPVLGVFTNSTLDGFGLGSVSNAPAIVYTNAYQGEFECHMSAEVQCSVNGTRATVALRIDGAVDPESVMSVYAKTAGEPLNVHVMATPALTNGSTVQLVCTSDGDGDVLTFNQFKTSIKRFR